MKMFLVAVSSLCLCGILLCFLAYVTGNFPMLKATQDTTSTAITYQGENSRNRVAMQALTREADLLCSPCAEQMALLLDMMEQEWGGDTITFFEPPTIPSKTTARGWVWLSSEQREKAKQLFDQYGTEEGFHRLRESDPEAARQFERGRRPSRDVPDGGQSESGSKD